MINNNKVITLNIIGVFVLILVSCKGEKCESFNLKRIPFDLKHYTKTFQYSSGVDTITLHGSVYISEESRLSGLSNPTCSPRMEISYTAKTGRPNYLNMLFTFGYSPENDYTELSIWINSGYLSNIKIDADFIMKIKNNEEIVFEEMSNNNRDSSRMLKKITLQNMQVLNFEFLDGKQWSLVR